MKKFIATVIFTLLITGCSKNTDNNAPSGGNLKIANAWVRPAGVGMNSGAFFEIINGSEKDTLTGAEFASARTVQIHKSFKTNDGRMGMEHVPFVEIPADSKIEFKPMSYHVMLIRLIEELKTGDKISITLNFKKSGKITTTAIVR
jgi:copper(I)-binding protein